jgi:ubiquinone/menaquinone biosynthesis C-methylase UbiE
VQVNFAPRSDILPTMGNTLKGRPEHSAESFGDTRDHWWHDDFIEMVAKHWRLEAARSVLDVGCGVGHWGRVLAKVAPTQARVIGVEREPRWVEEAARRAAAANLSERFSYRAGVAEALPFQDGAFDIVTCQTLLIHVRDPAMVLAEMVRVTRPGGLVIAAEPTNATSLLVESIALGDAAETTAALTGFFIACQRGKARLGEGDNLLGESLPMLFRNAALTGIEIRQNDRVWSMVPPYSSPFEKAQVDEAYDAVERRLGLWDEATTRRYWLASGGAEDQFTGHWHNAMAHRLRVSEAIRARTFSAAGGSLSYLVWGWRDG